MLYTLSQSKAEKSILLQCAREGLPLPERIQNAPELFMGNDIFFDAFWSLHVSRNIGMDIGPISWFDIRKYCLIHEYDEDLTESMHHIISGMDQAYLDWVREKRRQESKGKTKSSKS